VHILFLTDNYPPEVNAPASRTFEHAREWVRLGHRVTVITGAPNFPAGKVFEGYRNRLHQRELVDGIEVVRVWTFIAANSGFGLRIVDYLSFMISAAVAGLFVRRPDVIVGTSPQFFTAVAAAVVALLKRKPWVFELRDLWPESIRAVGAMKRNRLLDLVEKLELALYRHAAAVVSVTHAFKRNLVARGINADRIFVVTNGVDTTRFSPRPKPRELVRRLGLEGKFVAGYIGTHGMAHGLDTVVDAARMLEARRDDAAIVMLGDGAERKRLEGAGSGVASLRFLHSVAKPEVADHWALLDAAIIHLRRTDLFKTVIPSKIFEAMGMGIPIVLGVEGEAAEIVERHGVGLTHEPENAAELVAALERLMDDPNLARRLSAAGVAAAKQFDRAELAVRMLDILLAVSERRLPTPSEPLQEPVS
jgi:glycosyltransferase involved in cell wall biosynthesis